MGTTTAVRSPADLLGLRVPERDPIALVQALEQGLPARALPADTMRAVDEGLRLVLGL